MKKNMTFEEAMNRLEEIAGVLEAGETSLEKSIKLYEEGISLIKFCQSQLEEVAKKVQQLTKNSENNFQFKPFEQPGSGEE